tara:strand:- start:173 stop:535 length:363 start_codon:yes stop_codon:yes gene_type:complete
MGFLAVAVPESNHKTVDFLPVMAAQSRRSEILDNLDGLGPSQHMFNDARRAMVRRLIVHKWIVKAFLCNVRVTLGAMLIRASLRLKETVEARRGLAGRTQNLHTPLSENKRLGTLGTTRI